MSSFDQRMDDLHAVLYAAKVDRPAFFGMSEGGPISLLFAATHPSAFIHWSCTASRHGFLEELPDYPWGFTAEEKAEHLQAIENHWGEGALAELFFGEIADIPGFRELYGRYQRVSASPTMAAWLWQSLLEIDVRGILVRSASHFRVGQAERPIRSDRRGDGLGGCDSRSADQDPAERTTLPVDDAVGAAVLDFVCGTSSLAVDERMVNTVVGLILSVPPSSQCGGDVGGAGAPCP